MRWSFRTNGNYIDFVHTDETSEAVESVIFHLHNTSRCVSWSLPSDTTRINFTIDEVKYSNILISDVDFDGTVMNSQDDFETGITGMFAGLSSSPGGDSGLPYLVYVALLSQEDEDPPTAIVLQNTLGYTPTFTRESVGQYKLVGNAIDSFPHEKTWQVIGSLGDDVETPEKALFKEAGEDYLLLLTYTTGNVLADWLLIYTPVEVRVYP